MTIWQEKVYSVVKTIPRGEVWTYSQVAAKLGRGNSARAVGNALNKNYDKNVPCHRVVRSDGQVGGFRSGTAAKIKLLRSEGVKIKNGKVTSL